MIKFFDAGLMFKALKQIIPYIPVTLEMTFASMLIGLILAFLLAIVRMYNVPVFKQIATVYISFMRGTPQLVQLYLIYYGIPRLLYVLQTNHGMFPGYKANAISPIFYAIFAFSLNAAAYLSETIRSSIESIDKGQMEAAQSMGISYGKTMRKIILPQAMVVALPNLGNLLMSNLKGTSLAFIITIVDIMGQAKIIGARNYSFFEVYVAVSIIYWILNIVIEAIVYGIEKKLRVYERGLENDRG